MKKAILILSALWFSIVAYSQNLQHLDSVFKTALNIDKNTLLSECENPINFENIDIDSLFKSHLDSYPNREFLLDFQKPIMFDNIDSLLNYYFENFDKSLEMEYKSTLTQNDYMFFRLFNNLADCHYIKRQYVPFYDINPTICR